MYLKKLEIHGFKSFGDAVKLEIPQGITAVIGPNGSGKSNVADAIRWVLGEQSAKTLRGSKMEDIIFAGTEKRKSLGYAEVSMTIRNKERQLPIDYEEVKIKRRVYRSGESEYFINQSHCRLKDIQELFMDTGVGKEGYSIIGQGQIDKILSSKPEDRRSLFEEAAGIYKYKVRRYEAERKLMRERENLVRIDDIMSEIQLRLEPLEKEAEKTKHYLSIKDKLKDYEVNVFVHAIQRIEEELMRLNQMIEDVENQHKEVAQKKAQSELAYQKAKEDRDALFVELEALMVSVNALEKEEQKKDSEILINQERIKSIENLEAQMQKDTNKQKDYRLAMEAEQQVLQTKKIALEIEKATHLQRIEKFETVLNQHIEAANVANSQLEHSKTDVYDKIRQIDGIRSQINSQQAVDEQLAYRKEQVIETISRLNSELAHQEVQIRVCQKKMDENKAHYTQSVANLEAKEKHLGALQQATQSNQKQLELLKQKQTQAMRQIKWLEQIREDHEGYFQSVKQVLSIKKQDSQTWQGIRGVVAELIEVPERYELAMVTALGGAMQNIVTQQEKDATAMIALMKQKGIGRVTFLPLDTVQAYGEIQDIEKLRNEVGFLGLGNEVIHYDDEYKPVVKHLLGRIIIVDTIEHASQIAKKYRYRYKIVTLDGDVFNAGGSLSGGSIKNNKNNIFAKSRELKELKEQTQKSAVEISALEPKIDAQMKEHTKVLEMYNTLKEQVKMSEIEYQQLEITRTKYQNTLQIAKTSQLQLVEEKVKIEAMHDKSEGDQADYLKRIETLEETIKEDQSLLKVLEGQMDALRISQDKARNDLTEQRIDYSRTMENIKHIESQCVQLTDKMAQTEMQNENISVRQEELSKDKEAIYGAIEVLREEIVAIQVRHKETEAQKEVCEAQKSVLEQQEHTTQTHMRELEEVLQNIKDESYRLDHKKTLFKMEHAQHSEVIWEQYELSYSACLPFVKPLGEIGEMKKEADRLRAQIKTIGSIHVNAVTEYDETKSRYEFLTTQRLDIEKAEETLMEMIDTLTVRMHEIFREQFEAIATNFSQVFKELFGGGTAFLQLVDEENILESGIEIIAKPPGKKLQNMTLLSGGERTLTAIALLFGILKLKPSPFCVLDEIEAALDDANVLRFANYLESLSDETQFVIITHRKGTMESADTLYGVTMQERGVSTVLSIQLDEARLYMNEEKE